jgi:exonuclease III
VRTPRQGKTETVTPKKRVNINIANLSLNGAAAPTQGMNLIDKWTMINSTTRTEKIAILALQDTHLDEERLGNINRCFSKNFDIIDSSKPMTRNPRGSAGVAFIVNKALIAPANIQTHNLKQGRAILMRIKWSETDEITITNIYAPNSVRDQLAFWA